MPGKVRAAPQQIHDRFYIFDNADIFASNSHLFCVFDRTARDFSDFRQIMVSLVPIRVE
jgi:hypothetical protein